MLDRLNQVSCAAALPTFVTMTLPDESFHDSVGEFAKRAKVWLDVFQKRLLRVCPEASGFWRIEWQARKSGLHEGKLFPHFHLLLWGLQERVLGERAIMEQGYQVGAVEIVEPFVDCVDHQKAFELVGILTSRPVEEGWQRHVKTEWRGQAVEFAGSSKYVNRVQRIMNSYVTAEYKERTGEDLHIPDFARYMSFADWASLAWYHVVGSHNVDHLTAGFRCERVRSWGGVMAYAAKYMGKEDVNFLGSVEFGRSWGICNRSKIPWAKMVELDLDSDVGVTLRRIARRYIKACSGRTVRPNFGITLYCDVQNFRRIWERPPPDPF